MSESNQQEAQGPEENQDGSPEAGSPSPSGSPEEAKKAAVMSARGRMHVLKCHPGPFGALASGAKRFEWRKFDRDYQVGDVLTLQLYYPESGEFSLQSLQYRVTYIISKGFGIPPGYCIMSLGPVTSEASTVSRPGEPEQSPSEVSQ